MSVSAVLRLFDPGSNEATVELRAIIGFLTRDDLLGREELKSESARLLCPWLSQKYNSYIDKVGDGKCILNVKSWVTFALIKLRAAGHVNITVGNVLSSAAIEEIGSQSYFEYWAYAETLYI